MIKVKKDWWKGFFNHIYLITDARSVCDDDLTSREVDFIEKMLNLKKTDRILDLFGGQGRHSLELARRGYRDLTVLDYSDYLINLGRKLAEKENLKIHFIQGDARSTGLGNRDYSVIMIMANSFGYFPEEQGNYHVLKEANRLLEDKGTFLIDMTDPLYVKNNLKPQSWHQIGDVFILRQREIEKNLVRAREIVISQKEGLLRDGRYCIYLFSKERLKLLLKKAGFEKIEMKTNLSLHKEKRDYGFLTSRIIVRAIK